MENLPVNNGNGQAFGYVLYETTIFSSGVLSGLVRDRGQVGAFPLNSQDFVVTRHGSTYLILRLTASGCQCVKLDVCTHWRLHIVFPS